MNMKKLSIYSSFFIILLQCALIKAPMIVVQGSIQLWPVTIINNSGMDLAVTDEIEDPTGRSAIVRIIRSFAPNNQFTFQWPSTHERPNTRQITIFGNPRAANRTNSIIIGNTANSNYPMVASGDFYIIRLAPNFIAIADKLNPGQASGR